MQYKIRLILAQLLFYGGLALLIASFIVAYRTAAAPALGMLLRTSSLAGMLIGIAWLIALGQEFKRAAS